MRARLLLCAAAARVRARLGCASAHPWPVVINQKFITLSTAMIHKLNQSCSLTAGRKEEVCVWACVRRERQERGTEGACEDTAAAGSCQTCVRQHSTHLHAAFGHQIQRRAGA